MWRTKGMIVHTSPDGFQSVQYTPAVDKKLSEVSRFVSLVNGSNPNAERSRQTFGDSACRWTWDTRSASGSRTVVHYWARHVE